MLFNFIFFGKDYVYNYGITFNNIDFYNEYRKIIDVGYTNYELEDILPSNFTRVSKSSIANINHIYSIDKNLIQI